MAMVISDIEKREMIIRLLDGFGLNSDQKTNATIGLPDKSSQFVYMLPCPLGYPRALEEESNSG